MAPGGVVRYQRSADLSAGAAPCRRAFWRGGGAGDAAQRCGGWLAVCACAAGEARQRAGCNVCVVPTVDSRMMLVGARRMPRARRGVVSPADAAAARKRLLEAQLGEAKAAKAAKSSKGKFQSGVVASPKSERVDPPGSPSTSSSAPGNKKVELKPVSPPVRPEPQKVLEEECKACQGAHRAHTVRRLLPAAHGNQALSTPAPKMCCGSADSVFVHPAVWKVPGDASSAQANYKSSSDD